MRRFALFLTASSFLLTTAACGGGSDASAADTIYYNAKVITVDADFDLAEAVATLGDKIVAVGTNEEVRKLASKSTNEIDLEGKTLIPGFYDTHSHLRGPQQPWKWGGFINSVPEWLVGVDTMPKLQKALVEKISETPKGEWVVGALTREEWPNFAIPTRSDLDIISPDNPVVLRRGPHTSIANSLALKLAGISRDTKVEGGEIVHGPDGEPNGKIFESGQELLNKVIPQEVLDRAFPGDKGKDAWKSLLKQMASVGITSVNIAGIRPPDIAPLNQLYEESGDELPRLNAELRVFPTWDFYEDPMKDGVPATIKEFEQLGNPSEIFSHPKLKMSGMKINVDGGLSAPIFYSVEDYASRPGFHGSLRIPENAFYAIAKYAHDHNWQIGVHTMGDAATIMSVDTIDRIMKENPRSNSRHYLHHVLQTLPEETMKKMAVNNIIVSSQPGFLLTLGAYGDEALKNEQKERQNPGRSLLDHGIKVVYGSDALPTGPISHIFAGVTRTGWDNKVHGIEEAVTIQEALRMHTADAAYITYDEGNRGSIEPGKFADLVILDSDPLTIDPSELWTIKVERTIIGGKEVFNILRDGDPMKQ